MSISGRRLLDANIVIALIGKEAPIAERLKAAGDVLVPSIVMGELYFGACKSSRVAENLARLDRFAAENVIVGVDNQTARRFGEIKDRLRRKGRPVPENDIWIAAIAVQHDLILISRDRHFSVFDGLRLEVW
jgi:tRNA(fMet)-specific endonuclease VapC